MAANIKLIKIAAGVMALAVILGAFGAHSLKESLSANSLASWKTGVLYMMIHGLSILALGMASFHLDQQSIVQRSAYLFLGGILLFSGSIFLLSTKTLHGLPVSWLGPITPIGGLLFIAGWLNLLRLRPIEK